MIETAKKARALGARLERHLLDLLLGQGRRRQLVRRFVRWLTTFDRQDPAGIALRVGTLAGIVFVVLFAAVFAGYEFSVTPTFCNSCHFMEPYVESWKHSSHKDVYCVECHFEPGALHELRGKWKALKQLVSYVTQTYTSKPFAEISDASCLRGGCHETRLLEGKVTWKIEGREIHFDHQPHLTQMRRGMKLRCTSCHSQMVIGSHVQVTEGTCFLCHLHETERVSPDSKLGKCGVCHGPPEKTIEAAGFKAEHKDFVKRNIECTRCHADVISGDGRTDKRRCFNCHNEPDKIEKAGNTDEMHIEHTSVHKIECESCHDPIKHEFNKHLAETQNQQCQSCHTRMHNPPRDLFLGVGGEGVKVRPDPMAIVGISCAGCHVIPLHSGTDAVWEGQTKVAGTLSCASCHENEYKRFDKHMTPVVEDMVSTVLIGVEKSRQKTLKMNGEKGRKVHRLLKRAESNARLVRTAHPIHNPFYSVDLLKKGAEDLKMVASLVGFPVPVAFSRAFDKENCTVVCHGGLEGARFVDAAGTKMRHDVHIEKGTRCLACHPGDHPPEAKVPADSCHTCHHEETRERSCLTCHKEMEGVEVAVKYSAEPFVHGDHFEEFKEGTAKEKMCGTCHEVGSRGPVAIDRESCRECHEPGEFSAGFLPEEAEEE